jgi:hypothetical protein
VVAGCANFRKFLVEGTEPNLKQISKFEERSLMLVTALSRCVGQRACWCRALVSTWSRRLASHCSPDDDHRVRRNATRSAFSALLRLKLWTRLKNSTVSSSVRQRPS